MTARNALPRLIRLLALLVQVALPSLGVIADARLELEALAGTTHIEAESHECASRGHPSDCAICQYLRGPVRLEEAHEPVLAAVPSPPPATAQASPVRAGQRTLRLARGPPHLS